MKSLSSLSLPSLLIGSIGGICLFQGMLQLIVATVAWATGATVFGAGASIAMIAGAVALTGAAGAGLGYALDGDAKAWGLTTLLSSGLHCINMISAFLVLIACGVTLIPFPWSLGFLVGIYALLMAEMAAIQAVVSE